MHSDSDLEFHFYDDGDAPSEKAGDVIGRYTLVKELGHGGFGTVWMADQQEPVRRQVALKIIKLGMDTRQVVARFEQERQALALMDHPNVARVLDAGSTATGRPYFVMDLVKGEPIGEYCDGNKLTVDQRLRLFEQVCNAVQHAHGKGIIHRDLKPSNVLVSAVDGRPHATVIDFGIAKATSQKLTEKTLFTAQQQVVGTVHYMSPEQAEGSIDIDTRTDVYSLGVVLYELLTGSTPFNQDTVRHAMFAEVQRMIREVEPPKPSSRITQSHETLPGLAAARSIEPGRLGAIVRGELDWIVMKALEKDRSRRYDTASALALDIAAYLNGDAVLAAPPGAAYRLRKFVRRNRLAVVAASAVAVALLVGVIGFAWQASIARGQRDRAVHAEEETGKRARELQKVSDYQARMLQTIDVADAGIKLMEDLRARHHAAIEKTKAPEPEKSARTESFDREIFAVNATDAAVALLDRVVLAPAVRTIETEFADQPLVDASLRTTLGAVYQTLGRPEQALLLYERAAALRTASLGGDHLDTLASRRGVGTALGTLQRLDEAESTVRAALAGYERALGKDHPETLSQQSLLATQMYYQGKYDASEGITRDVLERRRRVQGPDHPDTLNAMNDLGMFLMNRGKYADAEVVLRAVVEGEKQRTGALVAGAMSNLGLVLFRQRKYTAAEPYMREALEWRRRDQGEDHPETVMSAADLASVLMDAGKLAEAEPLAKEALQKSRRIRGNEHSDTLKALNVMGQVLMRQNKPAETEPYYREALATGRRVLGEEHPDTIVWIANLGTVLRRLGQLEEAEALLREAVDKSRRQSGETHPYTLTVITHLSELLRQQGRTNEAKDVLQGAADKARQTEGEANPETLTVIKSLVDLLRQRGGLTEAETRAREGLDVARRLGKADDPETLAMAGVLASVLRDEGKLDEAEPFFEQVLNESRRLFGEGDANTLLAILRMATLRSAQGKHAEVLALLTPIEDKVAEVFPGGTGLLRHASLVGLLGKARAGLATKPDDYAAAEKDLLQARDVFATNRGENDKETVDWTRALVEFYAARDEAAPGKGYDRTSAEWQAKLPPGAASRPGADSRR